MPARKTVKKPGELKLAALPEPIAAVRDTRFFEVPRGLSCHIGGIVRILDTAHHPLCCF